MADTLDVSTWKRNPKEVAKSLKIVGDQTIATDEIRIIFPERFTSKGLCLLAVDGSPELNISLACSINDTN